MENNEKLWRTIMKDFDSPTNEIATNAFNACLATYASENNIDISVKSVLIENILQFFKRKTINGINYDMVRWAIAHSIIKN